MIVLNHVKLFVDVVIAENVVRHHVRSDRRIGERMYYIRLLVDVGYDLTALEPYPLGVERRVIPLVGRRRLNAVKRRIIKRPAGHAPLCIQLIDRVIFLRKVFPECLYAQPAAAAPVIGVKLVVYLPADDSGASAEVLCKRGDDAAVLFAHERRGLANVAPGGYRVAPSAVVDLYDLRVFFEDPPRRSRGRGAHYRVYSRLMKPVDRTLKPAEVVFSLLRLHSAPGKFADPQRVHTESAASFNILLNLVLSPHFGIICGAYEDFAVHILFLVPSDRQCRCCAC